LQVGGDETNYQYYPYPYTVKAEPYKFAIYGSGTSHFGSGSNALSNSDNGGGYMQWLYDSLHNIESGAGYNYHGYGSPAALSTHMRQDPNMEYFFNTQMNLLDGQYVFKYERQGGQFGLDDIVLSSASNYDASNPNFDWMPIVQDNAIVDLNTAVRESGIFVTKNPTPYPRDLMQAQLSTSQVNYNNVTPFYDYLEVLYSTGVAAKEPFDGFLPIDNYNQLNAITGNASQATIFARDGEYNENLDATSFATLNNNGNLVNDTYNFSMGPGARVGTHFYTRVNGVGVVQSEVLYPPDYRPDKNANITKSGDTYTVGGYTHPTNGIDNMVTMGGETVFIYKNAFPRISGMSYVQSETDLTVVQPHAGKNYCVMSLEKSGGTTGGNYEIISKPFVVYIVVPTFNSVNEEFMLEYTKVYISSGPQAGFYYYNGQITNVNDYFLKASTDVTGASFKAAILEGSPVGDKDPSGFPTGTMTFVTRWLPYTYHLNNTAPEEVYWQQIAPPSAGFDPIYTKTRTNAITTYWTTVGKQYYWTGATESHTSWELFLSAHS
jgi:hypothetical protein